MMRAYSAGWVPELELKPFVMSKYCAHRRCADFWVILSEEPQLGKTHHVSVVLVFRNTSGRHDFRLPPSRSVFFILTPPFTGRLIDPVINPTFVVGLSIFVRFVFFRFVPWAAVVLCIIGVAGKQGLEHGDDPVIVITLPLDALRWPHLAGIERGRELLVKVWRLSERQGDGVRRKTRQRVFCSPLGNLIHLELDLRVGLDMVNEVRSKLSRTRQGGLSWVYLFAQT